MKSFSCFKISKKVKRSFTLIEIMIVMVIIGVLVSSTMPSLLNFSNMKGLDRQIGYVISDISLSRNKALSNAFDAGVDPVSTSDDSVYWGIRFVCDSTRNTYQLGYFDNSTTWVNKQTKALPPDFTFTCSNHIDLKFARGTGVLSNPSNSTDSYTGITINYKTTSKAFRVYTNGKIEIQ